MKARVRKRGVKSMKYAGKFMALAAIAFIVWLPIIVAVVTSFKTRSEIVTAVPSLLPESLNWNNYVRLFRVMKFGDYLMNSALVAGFTAVISLFVSSLAAYALVWLEFRGKNAFIALNLFVYIFPQILLAIPLFLMCYGLGLLDTRFALVLTYMSFILPFGIWMLKNYFQTISRELVEAALIDGCNYFQCLIHVVLPVCLPVLATVLTYSFVLGWNEYMYANILIKSDSMRTVAIGVQTLVGNHGADFGLLTAAAVVMIIPVIIFFIAVQRLFVGGLTMGSLKE